MGDSIVSAVRKQFNEEGLEATLTRKIRETPPVMSKITGAVEARIIAVSCETPPEGTTRWTLRLIKDRVIELQIVEDISHETIRRILKKTN